MIIKYNRMNEALNHTQTSEEEFLICRLQRHCSVLLHHSEFQLWAPLIWSEQISEFLMGHYAGQKRIRATKREKNGI